MTDVYVAKECEVRIEARAEQALRLRPACALGFSSTHAAVRAALERSGEAKEARLYLGRVVEYPWLSALLARHAATSRIWDPEAGAPRGEPAEQYVATVLRYMPEFWGLFDRWRVVSVSVEKVLVGRAAALSMPQGSPISPEARLPYDAIVTVALRR